MAAISLRHLIDHTAGFGQDQGFDPMFAPLLLQFDLGIDSLPLEPDVVTWLLAEPLASAPGEIYAYSKGRTVDLFDQPGPPTCRADGGVPPRGDDRSRRTRRVCA